MIHQYKLNGYNIVLDVFSGAVHIVDDVAYDIIALFENTEKEAIAKRITGRYPEITEADVYECLEDIEQLQREKKLFTPDVYADKAFDLKKRHTDIKALCLHVAHTCNLNCEYCFASQGKYHGDRALMSFETGKQALDFLIASSGRRTNLEVDFFGGEPLMNWDTVKKLVAYARSIEKTHNKNFRFTLTTNGVLIDDDVIAFANREMHNVVLSLRCDRTQIQKICGGAGQQKLLCARYIYAQQSGFYKGYFPHGRFRLYRAFHGAGGMRAGGSLRP